MHSLCAIFVFTLLGFLALNSINANHAIKKRFDWHDEDGVQWSPNCDFFGQDMSPAKVPSERCGPTCKTTPGCTHFTWTGFEGGTCWLKQGGTSLDRATHLTDHSVCGMLKASQRPPGGNDKGTRPTNSDEYVVVKKTVYAEARGEPEEGQKWVVWVLKNRAAHNKGYWGGATLKGVCLQPGQFECWNGKTDIAIDDQASYGRIDAWLQSVIDAPMSADPTGGCDHYNNPDKEGYPPWTNNCDRKRKIGNHQFYKAKSV